jgi:uncharacterized protein
MGQIVTKKFKIERVAEFSPKLIPILLRHEVAKAAVFGSVANGTSTNTSDLDLLIEFKGEKTLLDLVSLKLDLEEEIERKVDVLTYRSLNPLIKKKVLKQQVRIL